MSYTLDKETESRFNSFLNFMFYFDFIFWYCIIKTDKGREKGNTTTIALSIIVYG